jgi:hypothetical protein
VHLAPEEGKELGRIIQAGFLFAGGGTGKEPEKWTFRFPDEADDLPRKKSVRPWVEKFVLKRWRPPPVTTSGSAISMVQDHRPPLLVIRKKFVAEPRFRGR